MCLSPSSELFGKSDLTIPALAIDELINFDSSLENETAYNCGFQLV